MAVVHYLVGVIFILLTETNNELIAVVAAQETGKFWQITDIHLDDNYSEFGDTKNECHGNSSTNSSIGEFGNFNCDSPWILVKDSISAMKAIEASPDFILWTGDSSPHVKENELNWTTVYSTLERITTLLIEAFPTTKIIPVLGNHDSFPANDFPTDNVKQQYQGYLSKAKWDVIIPPEGQPSFRKGGYYTYYLSSNLSVIVLNTNMYLLYNEGLSNETDPLGQFAWLGKELQKAQDTNTKVIIAAHVPPGYFERLPVIPFMTTYFNDKFVDLLLNYSNVIVTQMYGHTHTDSFRVMSSNSESSIGLPKNHAFIAPSVTPWKLALLGVEGINPSIRLYKYNNDPFYILDYYQYFLNLTEANKFNGNRSEINPDSAVDSHTSVHISENYSKKQGPNSGAKWELLYTATELYKVKNLNLTSVNQMFIEIAKNDTAFKQYYKLNTVGVPTMSCDKICQHGHICTIRYVKTLPLELCLSRSENILEISPEQTEEELSPTLIKVYTPEPNMNTESSKNTVSYPNDVKRRSSESAPTMMAESTKPPEKHHKQHYQKEFIYAITGIAIGLFITLIVVVVLGRKCRAQGGFRYTRF